MSGKPPETSSSSAPTTVAGTSSTVVRGSIWQTGNWSTATSARSAQKNVTLKRQGVTWSATAPPTRATTSRRPDLHGPHRPRRPSRLRLRAAQSCRQGKLVRCQYKVTDALSTKVDRQAGGQTGPQHEDQDSYDLGVRFTGRRLVTSVKCDLGAGAWAWRVKARDQAGNAGYGPWRTSWWSTADEPGGGGPATGRPPPSFAVRVCTAAGRSVLLRVGLSRPPAARSGPRR